MIEFNYTNLKRHVFISFGSYLRELEFFSITSLTFLEATNLEGDGLSWW